MAHLTSSEYTGDGPTAVQTLPANPELEPEGVLSSSLLAFFSGLVFLLCPAAPDARFSLYSTLLYSTRIKNVILSPPKT